MGGDVSAAAQLASTILGTLWHLLLGVIALVAVVVAFCGVCVFLGWRIDRQHRQHRQHRRTPTQPSKVMVCDDVTEAIERILSEEDKR